MTTIKSIVETYLKKNPTQATKHSEYKKIKKLGVTKFLFGYSFNICLALGIVSPLIANADDLAINCTTTDSTNALLNSRGEVIGTIRPSSIVNLEYDNREKPIKRKIPYQDGSYSTVYRLKDNNLELEKYNNAFIDISSCTPGFGHALPDHETNE